MIAPTVRHRFGRALLVGLLLATLGPAVETAAAAPPVAISTVGSDPRVLNFDVTSTALRLQLRSRVYLPDAYDPAGPPLPVVYFLHGTSAPVGAYSFLGPLTYGDFTLHQSGPDAGRFHAALMGFDTQLDDARFVAVALDARANETICTHCVWIDGKDGQGLQMETFLHDELIPSVESHLNVRKDRDGRAVIGFSMGGWGAFLQAFRHPDVFSFAGGVSPVAELVRDPAALVVKNAVGFLRDQGYGDDLTAPLDNARFNPVDIAGNVAADGPGNTSRVAFTYGDSCVGSHFSATCLQRPALTNGLLAALEVITRLNMQTAAHAFDARGVEYDAHQLSGVHGATNATAYRDHFVDELNDAFAAPITLGPGFDFVSADASFEIWGYDVAVDGEPRFVHLLDAGRDGHEFTVAGTGSVDVTTPAEFVAGQSYTATVTHGGVSTPQTVIADAAGRLAVALELGTAASGYPQAANLTATTGLPQTTVTVDPVP